MNTKPQNTALRVLLAEDDTDDRIFFEQALAEIPISTQLVTVANGELVMEYLAENAEQLPDLLFLDLSMPRKTGFECLSEIKENKKFENIPVIVFSTSFSKGLDLEQNLINTLLGMGAMNFIRKTSNLHQFKMLLHKILVAVMEQMDLKTNEQNAPTL